MAYPKVDFKGFKKEVGSARAILCRHEGVYAFHIPGSGFEFSKEITDRLEDMLENDQARLVGFYKKPLRSPDLIDDLAFELGR